MAAVIRKVATVMPMILPARRMPFMLAMADEIEQNTIGTTTQNIRLTKIVPIGCRQVAPGQTAPTAQPATMDVNIVRINQFRFKKAFMLLALSVLFSIL